VKKIAMIPARMGSKRIPKKNIRLLNKIPLISYIIKAAKQSKCFDDIYINSESEILKQIALLENVKFYKRPAHLSTDTATNDDFVEDFLNKNDCDKLIQLLPTSPFISPKEIKDFVSYMDDENLDTLISVSKQQIECIYQGLPINFDQKKPTPPSQDLEPVNSYACGIMGWKKENFLSNIKNYNCAYHGGKGKIDFYELKGFSTVDIDTEEDFQLAEIISRHIFKKERYEPKYYKEKKERIETDVPTILEKDGVLFNDLHSSNSEIPVNVKKIISAFNSNTSWSKRIIDTENNSATLIHQLPGEGNRKHYHPDWNEWWYIVDGQWEWNIEGKKVTVEKNDIVFIPKGKLHHITAVGNKPAIRLAVSRADVAHIYPYENTNNNED
jgi:CMP-N-acetylneuraminic acid synthetase/quercetin dioxygenase-like cupin family protein